MLVIILSFLLCYAGVYLGQFFGDLWSFMLGGLGLLAPSMYILESLYKKNTDKK